MIGAVFIAIQDRVIGPKNYDNFKMRKSCWSTGEEDKWRSVKFKVGEYAVLASLRSSSQNH